MKSRVILGFAAAISMFGIFAPAASGEVLYDQTQGTVTGSAVGPRLADDFAIPPGPLRVVEGLYLGGTGVPVRKCSAEINDDNNGIPGEGGGFREGGAGGEPMPSGTGVQFNWKPGADDATLGSAGPIALLAPGNYWIEASCAAESGSWGWQTITPVHGREAEINDWCKGHGPEFPVGEWFPLSQCGRTAGDFVFRLEGQPLTSQINAFQLGKPRHKRNGGLKIPGTFTPYGTAIASGADKRSRHLIQSRKKLIFHPNVTELWMDPTAAAKKVLKEGEKLHIRIVVSYVRQITNAHAIAVNEATDDQYVSAPAFKRTLAVTLSK